METVSNLLNIPAIEKNTRFWMIRTKRGFFFDEYLRCSFIAIGWNSITASRINGCISREQEDTLKKEIKDDYDEKIPGTALNKCIKFCNEVKDDDIAMIVDRHRVAFAKIGEYYEEPNPNLTVELEKQIHKDIEAANPKTDSFECPYIKRRKITVLKTLNEDATINPYLFKAISVNRHSLSDLEDYAETILSSCFDSFLYDEKLTITFRITQRENINAIVLADFISSSAKIISNNQPELVTVKTTLHSPGEVLLQIYDFVKDNALPILCCYMVIFGGKIKDYEFNSIIGIIKDCINHDYNKRKQELELRKMEADADLAEQEVIAKKLENEKKQRDLQLAMTENCMPQLAKSAEKLQIQPSDSTIIDITKIIKQHNSEQQTNN